ncbi:MAG: DUF4249 family protein [Flavobacteriaceae bacterium]
MHQFKFPTLAFLFICLAVSAGCEEIIDVGVPDAGPRLVVDASIEWQKNRDGQQQTIRLKESTAYFSDQLDVAVVGASVSVVKDDDGQRFEFSDQNNGDYTTDEFIPELQQSYTLEIEYEGKSYRANETLMPVNPINRVEQTLEGGFGDDEIQLKVYFNDPAEAHNFYFCQFSPENMSLATWVILDDEFSDGNENFMEFDHEDLTEGVNVPISLHGISQAYYNYINQLLEQTDDNGPFATTPSQLKGNCYNPNDPDEEVLGYFRLGEVDKTIYVIE